MTWQARVAAALGARVSSALPVQGGDLSEVFCVTLDDGRRMAVKIGPLVGREARMLSAIEAAGAAVPAVIWYAEDLLCLDWLAETRATPAGWQSLGRTLARSHAASGGAHGWNEGYAFGSVTIDNRPCADWPVFWADRRLRPFLPDLPPGLARRVEALACDLHAHLPAAPAPSLLHGDLWTGNALFSDDRAYLIDPACYYGHGEVDLAMLCLFGRPDPTFWQGYGTPDPGWMRRRPIYQLWPALVHLRLFGAGYRGMVEGLLGQAGA